jgi:sulfur carrier protein
MNITVNGEKKETGESLTLEALLRRLGHGESKVAVAINMTFVPRSAHATTTVRDGDDVEIVEPRQGG